MDIKISHNTAIHFYLHVDRFMLGDSIDTENTITYETVQLNLTGYTDYNTTLPWFTVYDYDG